MCIILQVETLLHRFEKNAQNCFDRYKDAFKVSSSLKLFIDRLCATSSSTVLFCIRAIYTGEKSIEFEEVNGLYMLVLAFLSHVPLTFSSSITTGTYYGVRF